MSNTWKEISPPLTLCPAYTTEISFRPRVHLNLIPKDYQSGHQKIREQNKRLTQINKLFINNLEVHTASIFLLLVYLSRELIINDYVSITHPGFHLSVD